MSVRRLRISSLLLNSFLRDNELWTSDLPADSNVIGIAPEDPDCRCFVLLIESDEFPAVAQGELIPFVDAAFARREGGGDAPSR